ncbi:MAG: Ig-like domain-containing protein, partial [Candidatus Omnitrophica bacterium]|nr:Ig-like domain-containing protein [Candidatus Omnitrophota bacterium]
MYSGERFVSTTPDFTISDISDGSHKVYVIGKDNVGNWQTTPTETSSWTVDTTGPTVSLTSSAPANTNTSPIPVTATFNENVSDFVLGDITIGNGNASNLAGGPTVYTFDVTPTVDGTVTIDILAGVATDSLGNSNSAAAQLSRNYDTGDPAPVLSSAAPNPTNTSPIPVSVNFGESVTGFAIGDITVGNGAASNLAGGPAVYTFDVTPTADGAVTVDIAAGVAQDLAGNTSLVATQLSRTYDGTVPTVVLTSAAPNPTNTSPIPVTATFSENVTGFTEGEITIGNGSVVGGSLAGGPDVYTFNVTPAGDGAVTVNINAGVAQDSAGNNNTAAAQLSRTYDNTDPVATLSAPSAVNGAFTLTVDFSENVTGFAETDISVTNGTKGLDFTAVSAKQYTITITPTADPVDLSVAVGAGQDAAGNDSTADSISVAYDNTKPTPVLTTPENPTNDDPFIVTVNFGEAVNGFIAADIDVVGATKGAFTGVDGDSSYTISLAPTAGIVTVNVAADVAADLVGNTNNVAVQLSVTYDAAGPTPVLSSTAPDPTNTSPIPVIVNFGESVSGFALGDITVGNGAAGNLAGGPAAYTFDVTPAGQGVVTINIAAGVAADLAGNNNNVAAQLSRTYDGDQPTVTLSTTALNPTNTSPIPVTATFSEDVTGFVVGDIIVGNGTAGNFAGGPKVYTFSVTPSGQGAVTIDIAAGVATDGVNNNQAAVQLSRTYDNVVPSTSGHSPAKNATGVARDTNIVLHILDAGAGVNQSTITMTVEGSNVTGSLAIAGSAADYTVTYNPAADFAYDQVVDVVVNASDSAGNPMGSDSYSFTVTSAPPPPDTTAPSVSSRSPSSGATDVAKDTNIVIHLVDSGSGVNQSSIVMTVEGAGVSPTISGSGADTTVTYDPPADFAYSQVVDVTITASDTAGNAMASPDSYSFTIQAPPDTTRPTITTLTTTASEPTSSASIPVTLTFSESVTGLLATEISVTNGSVSGFSGSGANYSFTVTASAAGVVSIKIPEGVAQDASANTNTESVTLSRTYSPAPPDTTRPTITSLT